MYLFARISEWQVRLIFFIEYVDRFFNRFKIPHWFCSRGYSTTPKRESHLTQVLNSSGKGGTMPPQWTRRRALTRSPDVHNAKDAIPERYACRGCSALVSWGGAALNVKVTCQALAMLGTGDTINAYAPCTAKGCDLRRRLKVSAVEASSESVPAILATSVRASS